MEGFDVGEILVLDCYAGDGGDIKSVELGAVEGEVDRLKGLLDCENLDGELDNEESNVG